MADSEESTAQQIEKVLRIRNTKAKSMVMVKNPETGKEEPKLIPYEPNRDGFYYDNERRKWILGIDPAGNINPVMLSTCRDPASPTPGEATQLRGRESKGWLWLERIPYAFQGNWEVERVKEIDRRRAAHHAKARKDAPNQMESMMAYVHHELRPLLAKLATETREANKADAKPVKAKDAP